MGHPPPELDRATMSGTVANIVVRSIAAPRLVKLEIDERTTHPLPSMSSAMPRRSPLYDTMTWSTSPPRAVCYKQDGAISISIAIAIRIVLPRR